MRDYISVNRAANLHPKIRQDVIETIDIAESKFPKNIAIRIVQGLRTIDEQNALYAQGRTKPGNIVTNAKGGQSYHNYGLAIDFAILYDKDNNGSFETLSWDLVKDFDRDGEADWMEVVEVFESRGWSWGGRWKSIKDNPHFEKSFGYSTPKLLEMYKNKQIIPGTPYVNL